MKPKMAFLIFFTIVLTIYALANYYIFIRGLQALPSDSPFRTYYIWLFWVLASTYVTGRILENIYLSTLSDILVWTGSFWLGAMLYFFLLVLFVDLLRLVNQIIPFFPAVVAANMGKVRMLVFAGSVALVTLTLIGGHINTRYPRIRQLDIHINKEAGTLNNLRVVMMSDIHMGTLVGNGQLRNILDRVRSLEPDIILLAGDILDEDLAPVIRKNTGEILRELQAPLGVYGIMGNHEHIGGSEKAQQYLENHGIHIIRDSVVKVAESFYLVGRDDRDKARFTGRKRKPLSELIDMTDKSYPVILLDHQPFYLEKAAGSGVDLQLSGHTHHGQMWPLSYITRAMYTISYGYGQVNGMHAYVSNGVGTWGPPVRVGKRPEIVNLKIRFGKTDQTD